LTTAVQQPGSLNFSRARVARSFITINYALINTDVGGNDTDKRLWWPRRLAMGTVSNNLRLLPIWTVRTKREYTHVRCPKTCPHDSMFSPPGRGRKKYVFSLFLLLSSSRDENGAPVVLGRLSVSTRVWCIPGVRLAPAFRFFFTFFSRKNIKLILEYKN